jgi:hypothetical protein
MVGGSTPCTAGDALGEGLREGRHRQLVTTGGDKCQQVSTAEGARGHVTPLAVSPPPRRPRGEPRVRPAGQVLADEVGLVTAFLQQIISDTRSEKEPLRTEAVHFVRADTAVRFWCSLVGL